MNALTISYEWRNGSNTLGNSDTLSLNNTLASPSDSITCIITASDPHGASASDSDSVVVDNIDPTVDSVSISPRALRFTVTPSPVSPPPQMPMGAAPHCPMCGRLMAAPSPPPIPLSFPMPLMAMQWSVRSQPQTQMEPTPVLTVSRSTTPHQ